MTDEKFNTYVDGIQIIASITNGHFVCTQGNVAKSISTSTLRSNFDEEPSVRTSFRGDLSPGEPRCDMMKQKDP